jgi:salicylate hydroxylase
VAVFEQARQLSEVGAGIQVSPNAVRILRGLGLGDRLHEMAVRPAAIEMRRWDDGRTLIKRPLGDEGESAFGAPYYVMHRADLLNVLLEAVPDSVVHLGHRCVGIVQDDKGVELSFDNGSRMDADVVVGADGIHSIVRDALLGPDAPLFSGLSAYRGLVPIERLGFLSESPVVGFWLGPHRHFVHYPVSSGRLMNFVAVIPDEDWRVESWTAPGKVEDALDEFAGWHDHVRRIIGAADETKRWALYDRKPLASWTSGRVTLLGDAAHPMLPFLSQGAVQAIEDAAVLTALLSDASPETVMLVLQRYEAIRKPRTSKVQKGARMRAEFFHLVDGEEQRQRDAMLADDSLPQEAAWLFNTGWIYGHDIEQELREGAGVTG